MIGYFFYKNVNKANLERGKIQIHQRHGEEKSVESVKDSSVSGEYASGILDVYAPLEHRLYQIPQLTKDADDHSNHQPGVIMWWQIGIHEESGKQTK